MCRGRLCRCILVVPSLAGCCFMLSCPLFRCFTRAAVVLRAVEGGADVSIHATLAALPCVASRSPEHARVLGGGTQAPAALLPFSAPDLPACALLCRFHPPLPPQVSLEQVRGLSPSTLTCGPPVRVKVKVKEKSKLKLFIHPSRSSWPPRPRAALYGPPGGRLGNISVLGGRDEAGADPTRLGTGLASAPSAPFRGSPGGPKMATWGWCV